MRLIAGCPHCDKWSIVRIHGMLNPQLITEAQVPDKLNIDCPPSEFRAQLLHQPTGVGYAMPAGGTVQNAKQAKPSYCLQVLRNIGCSLGCGFLLLLLAGILKGCSE